MNARLGAKAWRPVIPALGLIALTAVLLVALVGARYDSISQESNAVTAQRAGERARVLSSLLRDSLGATLRQADTLHAIAARMTRTEAEGNRPLAETLRPFLEPRPRDLDPYVAQISALDGAGRLLWTNADWSVHGLDMADRPHVRALLEAPGQDMVFSLPLVGRLSGESVVQYLRALPAPGGGLAGITVLSLRAGMLARLCEDLALQPGDMVSLLRDDGAVLMRRDQRHLGEHVAGVAALLSADPATARPGPIDGAQVFLAAQRVPGTPLVVMVTLSAAESVAVAGEVQRVAWRGMLLLDAAIIGLALAAGFALVLLGRAGADAARADTLARSEAWFRAISEDLADGITVCDGIEDGVPIVRYANQAVLRMFGRPREEVVGQPLGALLVPEDRPHLAERMRAGAARRKLSDTAYRVQRPDGSIRWYSVTSAISPDSAAPERLRMITVARDITEARAREVAFAEAHMRLERLLELVPGVFYHASLRPDGTVRTHFVSDSVTAIYGIPKEDAMRPGYLHKYVQEDLSRLRLEALTKAGPGGVGVVEFKARLPTGEVWLRDTLRQIAGNGPEGEFVGFLSDVTAERAKRLAVQRMNWALAAYSGSMAALVHAETLEGMAQRMCDSIVAQPAYALAVVGLVEHGPDRNIRILAGAGPAGRYREGLAMSWSEDPIEGRGPSGLAVRTGLTQVITDMESDPLFAPWRERARRFGIRSTITVPVLRDGAVLATIGIYAAEPDAFGPDERQVFQRLSEELAFAFALEDDRARLRAAEAARREAEENLRAAALLGPGLLYRARVDAAGLRVEAVFGDLARLMAPIAGAEDAADALLRVVDQADFLAALRALAPEASLASEADVPGLDGRARWFRNTVRVSGRDAGGVEVIGYVVEVTEEKLREQHRQQVATLLTLGEMATGIAHELNQPLASISFAAQNAALMLAQPAPDAAAVAARLERIRDQAHRASRLIEHMRMLARNQPQTPQAVTWQSALPVVLEIMAGKLRGCGVINNLPADLPAVLGQPIVMEQVLLNLIGNAVDAYQQAGGALECAVRVSGRVEGAEVVLSVADHAGGIAPEHLGRVFEPFFTTKFGDAGTGLGLALVLGAVARMGGTISVENRDGGALFEVRLPRAPEGAAAG